MFDWSGFNTWQDMAYWQVLKKKKKGQCKVWKLLQNQDYLEIEFTSVPTLMKWFFCFWHIKHNTHWWLLHTKKQRKPPKFVKLHYPNSFEFYNNQQIDFLYGCNIRILDLTTNGEEAPWKKCFDITLVNPNT